MQPFIRKLFHLVFLFFVVFPETLGSSSGKLTEAENNERMETCGKETQEQNEYGGIFLRDETNSHFRKYLIAISSRHVVVNPNSKTLEFVYNRSDCKNNIQHFTIKSSQTWPGKLNDNKQAVYIGSCEKNEPRGFVIVEHKLHWPFVYTPHCLPSAPIHNGSHVEVFTTLNATDHTLEYIMTRAYTCKSETNEMCTQQLVTDFGGPVLDPSYENKTYVGHAFTHDEESIHIVPIHRYLKEICKVTGICEKSSDKSSVSTSSLLHSSLSKPRMSFMDAEEPVIHVNFPESSEAFTDPIIMSAQTFMDSEVIDGGETYDEKMNVEVEEIESSGERSEEKEDRVELNSFSDSAKEIKAEPSISGEKVLILFKSEEPKAEPDYEPFVMSVVPQKKVASSTPEESTIVRAEPFSAVIIPLSEQNNGPDVKTRFSTPEELLIAFLLMLSLTFFVLMCIYGCIDYTGKPYYWKPDLGNIPV